MGDHSPERTILLSLSTFSSAISTFSVLSATFAFLLFPELRRTSRSRFIFYLMLADLGESIAWFMFWGNENESICDAQGVLFQLFYQLEAMWTLVIALNAFLAFRKIRSRRVKKSSFESLKAHLSATSPSSPPPAASSIGSSSPEKPMDNHSYSHQSTMYSLSPISSSSSASSLSSSEMATIPSHDDMQSSPLDNAYHLSQKRSFWQTSAVRDLPAMFFCCSVSFLISLPLIIKDEVGKTASYAWCWVSPRFIAESFLTGPLISIICFILAACVYAILRRQLLQEVRETAALAGNNGIHDTKSLKRMQTSMRTLYYSLPFFICYAPVIINRVHVLVTGHGYFLFDALHAFFKPLQGALNFLIYGLSTKLVAPHCSTEALDHPISSLYYKRFTQMRACSEHFDFLEELRELRILASSLPSSFPSSSSLISSTMSESMQNHAVPRNSLPDVLTPRPYNDQEERNMILMRQRSPTSFGVKAPVANGLPTSFQAPASLPPLPSQDARRGSVNNSSLAMAAERLKIMDELAFRSTRIIQRYIRADATNSINISSSSRQMCLSESSNGLFPGFTKPEQFITLFERCSREVMGLLDTDVWPQFTSSHLFANMVDELQFGESVASRPLLRQLFSKNSGMMILRGGKAVSTSSSAGIASARSNTLLQHHQQRSTVDLTSIAVNRSSSRFSIRNLFDSKRSSSPNHDGPSSLESGEGNAQYSRKSFVSFAQPADNGALFGSFPSSPSSSSSSSAPAAAAII